MYIQSGLLERTCKNTIETILFCLEHATKGTIYSVGPMPELRIIRITSGRRSSGDSEILWGLSQVSGYNPPGKRWEEYRDAPGNLLEAMGWCVERQKSWTADNPEQNIRSIRKQVEGKLEDHHHMEPVLVRKTDLFESPLAGFQYPLDWWGNPIWQNAEHVVVAVIKIHFTPHTIQRGDAATKIIKKLSHTLGTELLSLYLRETYLEARQDLALQRLHSSNVIAHELRNTLIKLGFVFPAINAVLGLLREQWEEGLERAYPELESKRSMIERLNQLLLVGQSQLNGRKQLLQLSHALLVEQQELSGSFLPPEQEIHWLQDKIQPKWQRLLTESTAWGREKETIERLVTGLQEVVQLVTDESLASKMDVPSELKSAWPRFIHTLLSANNIALLDDILHSLDNPALHVQHKPQVKKIIRALKVLAHVICRLEMQTDNLLFFLQNGHQPEGSHARTDRTEPASMRLTQAAPPP